MSDFAIVLVHHRKITMRPEYQSCACGEYHCAALRTDSMCRNCADTEHPRGNCAYCSLIGPIEEHHICGKERGRPYSHMTLPACMNCHAVLSQWQQRWPASYRYRLALSLIDGLWLYCERHRIPIGHLVLAVATEALHAWELMPELTHPGEIVP